MTNLIAERADLLPLTRNGLYRKVKTEMKNRKWIRILIIIGVFALAAVLFYYAFIETFVELMPILRHGNVEEIQTYMFAHNDIKGVFATMLLQMLQVWTVVLSGIPIQVAAGVVYGTFRGFAMCHISSTIAMTASMYFWRRAGKKMEAVFPVDKLYQGKLHEYLTADTPPRYTTVLACMIPMIPNGLIPVMAARMDITVKQFGFAVWLGSFLNILICCAIGSSLINGDWHFALLYALIMAGMVVGLKVYQKQMLYLLRRIVHGKPQTPEE